MAEEGACPICGFERPQTDQDNCPQCDADLTCFKVLDSIPEVFSPPLSEHQASIVAVRHEPSITALEKELSAPVSEEKPTDLTSGERVEQVVQTSETSSLTQESKQIIQTSFGTKRFRALAAMLTFVVILIAIVSVFQLYHLRHLESGLQEQKTALQHSMEQISSGLAQLNQKKDDSTQVSGKIRKKISAASRYDKPSLGANTQISAKPKDLTSEFRIRNEEPVSEKIEKPVSETDFQNHTLKTGETLKSVAATYYGASKYYPIIIELNPAMPIDLQTGKGRLKIFNDPRRAAELYRKKTFKIGNRLYFSYTISKGDTLKGIALKFYRSPKMIKSILDLNPDSQFKPGERIRIRVE